MVLVLLIVRMCYMLNLLFKGARDLHKMARAKWNVSLFLYFHFMVSSAEECYCIHVRVSKVLQLLLNFNFHNCCSDPHSIKKEQPCLTVEQVIVFYCHFLCACTYLCSVKCVGNSEFKTHIVKIIFSSRSWNVQCLCTIFSHWNAQHEGVLLYSDVQSHVLQSVPFLLGVCCVVLNKICVSTSCQFSFTILSNQFIFLHYYKTNCFVYECIIVCTSPEMSNRTLDFSTLCLFEMWLQNCFSNKVFMIYFTFVPYAPIK